VFPVSSHHTPLSKARDSNAYAVGRDEKVGQRDTVGIHPSSEEVLLRSPHQQVLQLEELRPQANDLDNGIVEESEGSLGNQLQPLFRRQVGHKCTAAKGNDVQPSSIKG
jgi:hypothetical protein